MQIAVVAVLAAAGAAGYLVKKYEPKISGMFLVARADGSAFAKAAEADAKIAELKVIAEAKKAEVLAVHSTFDELHKMLGSK